MAFGHSAGGHLALWLAGRHRLPPDSPFHAPGRRWPGWWPWRRCPTWWSPSAWAAALLGGTPEDVPDRYAAASPSRLLPTGVRQVLLHGTEDDTVPLAMSEAYAREARALGDACQLQAVGGLDHFDPIDPRSPAFPAVLAAPRGLLG